MEIIIRDTDVTKKDFEMVVGLIRQYGGIKYTKARAQKYIDQAKGSLSTFQSSETRTLLEQLADYVLVRKM